MSETTNPTTLVGPGHIVHTEFASQDVEATTGFLNTVFGWQFQDGGTPEQGPYHMWGNEELGIGGAIRPLMDHETTTSVTPYVNVADLDATIEKATGAGAEVIVPKTPVPGMGWMAWFTIPGGNTIAIWQNDENAPERTN